ncbi:MAG: Spy/CpxP family protein refolding chaperone [Elusimicrobiota bacterium]
MKIKGSLLIGLTLMFGVITAEGAGRRPPEDDSYRKRSSISQKKKPGDHFERKSEAFYDKLDLSDEQKNEIKKQKEELSDKRNELRKNLRLKMKDMREALASDEINRGEIDALIEKISAIQKEILKNRAKGVYILREILSEEQWQQMKDKGAEYKRSRDKNSDKIRMKKKR